MLTYTRKKMFALVAGLALVSYAGVASAGPVVIDGTDANDHGFASGGANQTGWLYMQKVLENLANTVTASAAKVIVNLGADGSTQAGNAIDSAFSKSSLAGAGWTLTNINGAAAITTWLNGLSTSNTGILYIPTYNNASGDLDSSEMDAINARATAIDTFVGGAGNASVGGALFSQGEVNSGSSNAYGWLTTLIPGIVVTDHTSGGVGGGLTLTAAGNTAFPGLTNGDLSSGPWHADFSGNLGGLHVLAVGTGNQNVILGGGAGTVISCGGPNQPPCPPKDLPEPGMLGLLAIGLAGLAARRRKQS